MMMQQRRLKSARLEMIECLREQQKIQVRRQRDGRGGAQDVGVQVC